MSATTTHPGRVLFNGDGKQGLLYSLFLKGWEQQQKSSASEVAARFEAVEMKAAAVLALHLANSSFRELGSGSIDLERVTAGDFSLEAAQKLQSLYIGHPARGITPLEWLGYLSLNVDEIPVHLRNIADMFFGELYAMLQELENSEIPPSQ